MLPYIDTPNVRYVYIGRFWDLKVMYVKKYFF